MSNNKPTYSFSLRFRPDEGDPVFYLVEVFPESKTLRLFSSKNQAHLLCDVLIEKWKDSAEMICKSIEADCPGFNISQDVNMIAKLISVTFEANEPVVFFEKVG